MNKLGQDSEAELFKKIPYTEQLDTMLRADDTHVVITLRGIGEMTPQNPDSFVRLSPTRTEDFRSSTEVLFTIDDRRGLRPRRRAGG